MDLYTDESRHPSYFLQNNRNMAILWKTITFLLINVLYFLNIARAHDYNYTEVIRIKANYEEITEVKIDNTVEYVIVYPKTSSVFPYRVKVSAFYVDDNFPVLVVVRQEKDVLSWQVPLLVDSFSGTNRFYNTSRTLCHSHLSLLNSAETKSGHNSQISQSFIVVVSTSSQYQIDVLVQVEEETDFFVQKNVKYSLQVSPSEPRYVNYKFTDDDKELETVIIEIDSDDDVCLVVSVQNSQCPVFDLNKDITYEGKYQTVDLKGAITVTKKEFPKGFFLIFVAKGDNYECSQENSIIPIPRATIMFPVDRMSTVYFTIRDSISTKDYISASLITVAIIFAFSLFCLLLVCAFHRWGNLTKALKKDREDEANGEIETLQIIDDDVDSLIQSDVLYLRNLCKFPSVNKRRSYNYLWHILSIALFYSIPVVQLVIIYQRVVNQTGNLDMCYYNFRCAHPAFGFSDFNHIFSNVGYVFIGILFLLVVLYRHTTIKYKKGFGIPVHYGLFYAMGVALIIEGLLSACYHICPSQANYQFDTSFMYVMAVLCMVKLYQNRHPDINATAYATFTVLGVAIFTAMVGILNGSLLVWTLFICCYVAYLIYLSIKIYFFSYVLRGIKQFKNELTESGLSVSTLAPVRKGRFFLLLLANILNYTMLGLGVYLYYKGETDFGTFLLAILMGNGVVHATFYVIMKLHHKEKICLQAIVFCLLALATWAGSAYFFLDYAVLWTVTPAESRQNNQHCIWLDFYDRHDVWHLMSAPALFFTFMFLLCLDDDLVLKSQDKIPVF